MLSGVCRIANTIQPKREKVKMGLRLTEGTDSTLVVGLIADDYKQLSSVASALSAAGFQPVMYQGSCRMSQLRIDVLDPALCPDVILLMCWQPLGPELPNALELASWFPVTTVVYLDFCFGCEVIVCQPGCGECYEAMPDRIWLR